MGRMGKSLLERKERKAYVFKKRRLARGVALALAVLLMLPVRTLATTIDEVQNRQEELKQENEDLQREDRRLEGG